MALLDAQRGLIVDLVPCEDGHAQERSLLPELLERIRAGIVVVADRNFCTSKFFFGLAARQAFFAIRQHASTLHWEFASQRAPTSRETLLDSHAPQAIASIAISTTRTATNLPRADPRRQLR